VLLRSACLGGENEVAAGDIAPVPGAQFEETLAAAIPDLSWEMIKDFAQRMIDVDVEVRCNAGYGEAARSGPGSRWSGCPSACRVRGARLSTRPGQPSAQRRTPCRQCGGRLCLAAVCHSHRDALRRGRGSGPLHAGRCRLPDAPRRRFPAAVGPGYDTLAVQGIFTERIRLPSRGE
jgi:hypothetical protein